MTITTFLSGIANTHLIENSRGVVIVDAGMPNHEQEILARLRALGKSERDVRLILLTHAHIDHAGSAAALRRATGAPIAMHRADEHLAQTRVLQMPPGRNAFITAGARALQPLMRFAPMETFTPDIWLAEGQALQEFGLDARIIHTPGYTRGSISVWFDDGALFVGDAILNLLRVSLPLVWEDAAATYASAREIIALRPRVCYTGHGRTFEWNDLERFAEKRLN